VHSGESGTVNIDGVDHNLFTGTTLPAEYGGGNHGIYDDPEGSHDGRYAIVPLYFDLMPLELKKIDVFYEGFSIVHFDAVSTNGFWNPPSHDVSADPPFNVPEPSVMILLGSGIAGLIGLRKGFQR